MGTNITILIKPLTRLPLGVLYCVANAIYYLLYYILGLRKKTVYQNLKNSFPDKSENEIRSITKDFYRNLADVAIESFKARTMPERELNKRVRIINPEFFDSFIEKQQPVILLATHQANWEWALLACNLNLPFSLNSIYQPLHSKWADNFILAMRSRFGAKLIPSKQAIVEVIKRQGEFGAITMISDQSPSRRNIRYWTHFLNQDTAFHTGCDEIAQCINCPVVMVYGRRLKRGYYEISFRLLTQPPYKNDQFPVAESYARELEALIGAAPSDWLWMHRRWKHKKPLYT